MNQKANISTVPIGKSFWRGARIRVVKGATIRDGSIISAGPVVVTDAPSYEDLA